jgi:hypothetical protein
MPGLELFGRWHADQGHKSEDVLSAAKVFCSCHRRHGLKLWLYRGEHRCGAWTVSGLAAAIAEKGIP